MDFLARVRGLAGRRVASSAAWAESVVAGRAGAVGRAESCLAEALAAEPCDDQVLEDAAWYASDRGDAAQAVRYLDRLDEDPDEDRTRLLRRYAARTSPTSHTGRNEPCPCGSGRKYKHCCLRGPSATLDHPLPERVRWLWEKMRWWLDRSGREDDVLDVALELHGGLPAGDSIEFSADFDMAASLVLFADGAIHDFLRERGGLLPDDETNLVAQWALTERSLHQVVEVRPGEGVNLRDLRTGDVAEVRERLGSGQLATGDLICAHPVFDGQGQQLIGGLVPVPVDLRESLMTALDGHASSIDLGWILGATRRPPDVVNMEGQPTVLCEATYLVDDPARTAGQLDTVFTRHENEDDGWAEWTEIDGRRWMRSRARLDGDRLRLSSNSELRFAEASKAVTGAVDGLQLIDEKRTPATEVMRGRPDQGNRRPTTPLGAGPAGFGAGVPLGAEEALDAFMRQQEERWVDEPIPALSGLSPRQAAADPTRRKDLLLLLHDFDRHSPPPGAATFDPARLRRLLGLPFGTSP
jgi:hypothetical protein